MAVFAIGDLHLPGGDDKPMNVFGSHWDGHFERIQADWKSKVGEEDVVLIPGDISWAMQVQSAMPDLAAIGALPGKKILLRGNHDYWWCAITKLRDMLPKGMYAVQNDAMLLDGIAFCGTRGWRLPTPGCDAEDEKIYNRELQRMEMSLERAKAYGAHRLIVMCHYPPLGEGGAKTRLSALLESYHPDDVVYGHLHGPSLRGAVTGCIDGIRYHCVSCDGLNFQVYRLPDDPVGIHPTEGSKPTAETQFCG
ncbi:MAG: metallophosphoesterase [Clostridia bacterium]|nr:metallophosphoesterase [Clostridia bacterium]